MPRSNYAIRLSLLMIALVSLPLALVGCSSGSTPAEEAASPDMAMSGGGMMQGPAGGTSMARLQEEMMSLTRRMNSLADVMNGEPADSPLRSMMDNLQTMARRMNETMGQMKTMMNDRTLMANPDARQRLEAMQGNMRTLMQSMNGLMDEMEQIRKGR